MNGFLIGMLSEQILPFRSFVTARKQSLRRLCFHRRLSVQREGGSQWSLFGGVSVQGGLCLGSFGGVSVQGDLCLCRGSLSRGIYVQAGGSLPRGVSLQEEVSVQGGSLSGRPPSTVTRGRYASYWNVFVLFIISFSEDTS